MSRAAELYVARRKKELRAELFRIRFELMWRRPLYRLRVLAHNLRPRPHLWFLKFLLMLPEKHLRLFFRVFGRWLGPEGNTK